MPESIITSVIAYISTNIDDIFVIMLLLAQACGRSAKSQIVLGHFLGVGMITVISMLCAFGLQNIPLRYIGLLGLVPIFLGVRAWLRHTKEKSEESVPKAADVRLFGMAMITLGNGADNIGVYIPLFTGFSGWERMAAVAVFGVMTAVWVFLGHRLAEFPQVSFAVGKYRHILIPVVFIALGVYIILDSGLLGPIS